MPPPELSADAPITDIGKPVAVDLLPTLRNEAGILLLQGLAAAGRQGLRLHEPLR